MDQEERQFFPLSAPSAGAALSILILSSFLSFIIPFCASFFPFYPSFSLPLFLSHWKSVPVSGWGGACVLYTAYWQQCPPIVSSLNTRLWWTKEKWVQWIQALGAYGRFKVPGLFLIALKPVYSPDATYGGIFHSRDCHHALPLMWIEHYRLCKQGKETNDTGTETYACTLYSTWMSSGWYRLLMNGNCWESTRVCGSVVVMLLTKRTLAKISLPQYLCRELSEGFDSPAIFSSKPISEQNLMAETTWRFVQNARPAQSKHMPIERVWSTHLDKHGFKGKPYI